MKKLIVGLAVSAGLGIAAAPASAAIVAGINFFDIGGTAHLETMTLAEQFINPATTAPGTGTGQGYGVISTINGLQNTTGPTGYCAAGPCSLYYVVTFGGGTFQPGGSEIQFTTTDVTIFFDNQPQINLLASDSFSNLATIQAMTPYATLVGHGNLGGGVPADVVSIATGSLSGSILALTGRGLLDIDPNGPGNAEFIAFLNGDSEPDAAGGFADLSYTESANNSVLNPRDVALGFAEGCRAGTAATGEWCWQGTLNTRGEAAVIPEPGSVALLSLGLMVGGLVMRKRRAS